MVHKIKIVAARFGWCNEAKAFRLGVRYFNLVPRRRTCSESLDTHAARHTGSERPENGRSPKVTELAEIGGRIELSLVDDSERGAGHLSETQREGRYHACQRYVNLGCRLFPGRNR